MSEFSNFLRVCGTSGNGCSFRRREVEVRRRLVFENEWIAVFEDTSEHKPEQSEGSR